MLRLLIGISVSGCCWAQQHATAQNFEHLGISTRLVRDREVGPEFTVVNWNVLAHINTGWWGFVSL